MSAFPLIAPPPSQDAGCWCARLHAVVAVGDDELGDVPSKPDLHVVHVVHLHRAARFRVAVVQLRDIALREQRVIVQAELALQKKGEMAQLPAVWRAPASPRL